jgi:hypothetical protein
VMDEQTDQGWRSAGDLGSWDQAEVQPYERTAPAPPRSDRERRDRSEEDRRRFFPALTQIAIARPHIDVAEKQTP